MFSKLTSLALHYKILNIEPTVTDRREVILNIEALRAFLSFIIYHFSFSEAMLRAYLASRYKLIFIPKVNERDAG